MLNQIEVIRNDVDLMKILDRHFLKEFFKPFFACLVAFLLCMIVYDLFDNINDFIQAKTPLRKVFQYYIILIPAWLPIIVMPLTLLLSLLYTLSDMSKHGELTAMRASGLDVFRLMTPYFIIGILVTFLMLIINLSWTPTALYEAKVLFEKTTNKVKDSRKESVGVYYHNAVANRFWWVSLINPTEGWARGIEVTINDENLKDLKRITAESGNYDHGRWVFHNVTIYDYTLPITDPGVLTKEDIYIASGFTESPKEFVVEIKKTKRMTTQELSRSLNYASHLSRKQYALFSTELHSRITYPLSNLIVFLIGIPFGLVGQRSSNFMAIIYALAIFFAYFMVIQFLFVLGQSGRFPPMLAAWFPHLLFAGIGIYMIRKNR